jgi:hypothetical protein
MFDVVICMTCGQLAPESLETPGASVWEEGDQCSSYATGDSEQEELDMEVQNSVHPWDKSVEGMKRSLAALDVWQRSIVEKLSALEKVVSAVQEDTSWVRGDVQHVHEVVVKLSDYVSVLSNTVAMVEGVPEEKSPPLSAWGNWKGSALAPKHGSTQPAGIGSDAPLHVGDEERSHQGHDGDVAIQETQMYENDFGMERNTMSQPVEIDDEGWDKTLYTGRTLSLPPDSQPADDDEVERLLPDSAQVEMTIDCTQSATQAPGRSIYTDLISTVRDMAAPLQPGENSSEGWVQSKRGRASSREDGPESRVESVVQIMTAHTNLNLNMSPEKSDMPPAVRGSGQNSGTRGKGTGSRGGGRGGGRGAGRGKRPPLVSPRYAAKVSSAISHSKHSALAGCMYVSHTSDELPMCHRPPCTAHQMDLTIAGWLRSYYQRGRSVGCCTPNMAIDRWGKALLVPHRT